MWQDMTWFNQIISALQAIITIIQEPPFVYFIILALIGIAVRMVLSFVKIGKG